MNLSFHRAARQVVGLVLAAFTIGAIAQADDSVLAAAVDGPQRSATNRARDAARHPAETLRFFGLRPDMTVIEIAPGGGWYTEILAPYLRERGQFYAALNAVTRANGEADPGARNARDKFEARFAANPAVYGLVHVGTLPTGASFAPDIQPAGGADMVLTFRNIHNWIADGHLDATLKAFYAVLKPGGVLGVEEHRAVPGTPLKSIIDNGYVPEDYVIEHARAAGFELAARSEVNANPRDTKDHGKGVWALPPTLLGGEVDRAKFVAIGESDRMTLRFVKR